MRTVRIIALIGFAAILGSVSTVSAQATPPAQPKGEKDRVSLEELKKRLEEQKKGATSRPKAQPAPNAGGYDPADHDSFLAYLDRKLNMVPKDVRKSSLKPAQLHSLVDETLVGIDDFNRRYPQSEARARLLWNKARLISMNQSRHVYARSAEIRKQTSKNLNADELRVLRREYLTSAMAAVEEAAQLTDDPELALEIERVRGQIFYFGDYLQEAIDQYRKVLQTYPDDPKRAEMQTALIGSYDKARQFDGGLVACDEFLANHLKSEFAAHVINYKWKMLYYLGRLSDGIDHMTKYRPFMVNAFAGTPIESLGGYVYSPEVQKSFGTYLDRVDFQLGFANYALGRVEPAKEAFAKSIAHLQSQVDSGKIDQVGQVFMSRSNRLLETLNRLQGNPAPPIDLQDAWVTAPIDLEKERGNVVCLFFNPYENIRSEDFARAIQAYYRDRWNDGFRAAWIALPKGTKNWDDQMARLDRNRVALGVTYPTGLAKTDVWPPAIYTAYNIAPGTPTIVLLDREGKVAWYKMDPTFRDFELAGIVAERLMAESP